MKLFPGAPVGCYALVGSAAFFAGVARAPLTSIVMVFELTRNYALILPVMVSVVISTGVLRVLSRETVYTEKLKRRGIDILGMGRHVTPGDVSVGDVMSVDFPAVPLKLTLGELAARFVESGHHGFPVVNEDGTVYGIVTVYDLQLAEGNGMPPDDAGGGHMLAAGRDGRAGRDAGRGALPRGGPRLWPHTRGRPEPGRAAGGRAAARQPAGGVAPGLRVGPAAER